MTSPAVLIPVSLAHVHPHGDVVRSQEPLVVETGGSQWHYAISVPLSLEAPEGPLNLPVSVAIDVTVESGRLGCLLVAHDWVTQLAPGPRSVGPGRHHLDLIWERGDGVANLVFRNDTGGNRACVFRVESVGLSTTLPRSSGTAGFVDVLREGGRQLDVARLRQAVSEANQIHGGDEDVLAALRGKWGVVPAGLMGRRSTAELATLPEDDLRQLWMETHLEATAGDGFAVRGWYQAIYRDVLRDKKVLEIGSGMGIDGIEFARHGANMTFVDIVEGNLSLMRRLCTAFGVTTAKFVYMDALSALDALDDDYDVVWCQGSLINAPFDFISKECAAILRHLKTGGRWIELTYPRERWVRDGEPSFRVWGTMTDGEGTPWMEWYDLPRILDRLSPARFAPVLAFNFHNDDFNWFDLVRLG
jgi:SAM-dependent methyltransferase